MAAVSHSPAAEQVEAQERASWKKYPQLGAQLHPLNGRHSLPSNPHPRNASQAP
jgi:hypothetical protein